MLEGVLIDSQYIGTDTRFTVRIGEGLELVSRLQNADGGVDAAFTPGQQVSVRWQPGSATALEA